MRRRSPISAAATVVAAAAAVAFLALETTVLGFGHGAGFAGTPRNPDQAAILSILAEGTFGDVTLDYANRDDNTNTNNEARDVTPGGNSTVGVGPRFTPFTGGFYYAMDGVYTAYETFLVLDGYRGTDMANAANAVSFALNHCYPDLMVASFAMFYNDSSPSVTVKYYTDFFCETVSYVSIIDVASYHVTSFTTLNNYRYINSYTTSTVFPLTSQYVGELYFPYYYPMMHTVTDLINTYVSTFMPSHKGPVALVPTMSYYNLMISNTDDEATPFIDTRTVYHVMVATQHIFPIGCEKIGNYYFTDVYNSPADTLSSYNYFVTGYACGNDRCEYSVSGMCEQQGVGSTETTLAYSSDSFSFFFGYQGHVFYAETSTAILPYAHMDANFPGSPNMYLLANTTSIDVDYAFPSHTPSSFFGALATSTATYAVVTPGVECADKPDEYYDVNACYPLPSTAGYARTGIQSDGVYEYYYNTYYHYCGPNAESSSLVSSFSACQGTTTTTGLHTFTQVTTTFSSLSPTIAAISPSATSAAGIFSEAIHIPNAHQNATGSAVKVNDLTVSQFGNASVVIAAQVELGSLLALPVFDTCALDGSVYKLSLQQDGYIYQFICDDDSCDYHVGCTLATSFTHTNLIPSTLSASASTSLVYSAANTFTASEIHYTGVQSYYYLADAAVSSIASVQTYSYGIKSATAELTYVVAKPYFTGTCSSSAALASASYIDVPQGECIYDSNYKSAVYSLYSGSSIAIKQYASSDYLCKSATVSSNGVLPCTTESTIRLTSTTFAVGAFATPTVGASYSTAVAQVTALANARDFVESYVDDTVALVGPAAISIGNLSQNIYNFDYGYFGYFSPQVTELYPVHETCELVDGVYQYSVAYNSTTDSANLVTYICKTSSCDIHNPEDCYFLLANIDATSDIDAVIDTAPYINTIPVENELYFMTGYYSLFRADYSISSIYAPSTVLAAVPTSTAVKYTAAVVTETPLYLELAASSGACGDLVAFEFEYFLLDTCFYGASGYSKYAAASGVLTSLEYGTRDVNCATALTSGVSTITSCVSTKTITAAATTFHTVATVTAPGSAIVTGKTTSAVPAATGRADAFETLMASMDDAVSGVANYLASGNVSTNALFSPLNSNAVLANDNIVTYFTRVPIVKCAAVGSEYIAAAYMSDNQIGYFTCTDSTCPLVDRSVCTLIKTLPYLAQNLTFSIVSTSATEYFASANELAVSGAAYSGNSYIGDSTDIAAADALPEYSYYTYYVEDAASVDTYWSMYPLNSTCAITKDFYSFKVLLLQCVVGDGSFSKISEIDIANGYYRGLVYFYDSGDVNCASSALSSGYTTLTTTDGCYTTSTVSHTHSKYLLTSALESTTTPTITDTAATVLAAQVTSAVAALNTGLPPTYGDNLVDHIYVVGANEIVNPSDSSVIAYDVKLAAVGQYDLFSTCTSVGDSYFISKVNATDATVIDTYTCVTSDCPLDYLQNCQMAYSVRTSNSVLGGLSETFESDEALLVGYNSIAIEGDLYSNTRTSTDVFEATAVVPTRTLYSYYATSSVIVETYVALINLGDSNCESFGTAQQIINNSAVYLSTQFVLVDSCFKAKEGNYAMNIADDDAVTLYAYASTDFLCEGTSTAAVSVSYTQGTETCYQTTTASYSATHVVLASTTASFSSATATSTVSTNYTVAAADVYDKLTVQYSSFTGYISNSDLTMRALYDPVNEVILGYDFVFPLVVRYWISQTCVESAASVLTRRDGSVRQLRSPVKRDVVEGEYLISVFDKYNDQQLLSYVCETSDCNVDSDTCIEVANTTVVNSISNLAFDLQFHQAVLLDSANYVNVDDYFAVGGVFYGTSSELALLSTSTVSTSTSTVTTTSVITDTAYLTTTSTHYSTVTVSTTETDYATIISTGTSYVYTTVYAISTEVVSDVTTTYATLVTSVSVTHIDTDTETVVLTDTITITPTTSTIYTTTTSLNYVTDTVTLTKSNGATYTSTTIKTQTEIVPTTKVTTVVTYVPITTTTVASVGTTTTKVVTTTSVVTDKFGTTQTVLTTKTVVITPSTSSSRSSSQTLPPCGTHKPHPHNQAPWDNWFAAGKQYQHHKRGHGQKPTPPPCPPPHCVPESNNEILIQLYEEAIEAAQNLIKNAAGHRVSILEAQAEILIAQAKSALLSLELSASSVALHQKAAATAANSEAILSQLNSVVSRISSSMSKVSSTSTAMVSKQTSLSQAVEDALDKAQDLFNNAGQNLFNAFFN